MPRRPDRRRPPRRPRRLRRILAGPFTTLPNGRRQRAMTLGVAPFGVAALSLVWLAYWLPAARDWWRTRDYAPTPGVVQSSEVEEVRGHRGRKLMRPAVVVTYKRFGRTHAVARPMFDGSPTFDYRDRDEADAFVARYPPGLTVTVWVDPARPDRSILERRFRDSQTVNPLALPCVFAGWLGVVCYFCPPGRPRPMANGALEWRTRSVRLARLAVDGGIGFSIVGGYLYLFAPASFDDWSGYACAAVGLLMFGPTLGYPAVRSLLRSVMPGVSATLRPAASGRGWEVDYAIGPGLVRPRRVAVTLLVERRWREGSGRDRKVHDGASHVRTLARHADLPASGRLVVVPPDPPDVPPPPGDDPGRVRAWVVFHGGRAWWPDLTEAVRLPDDAGLGWYA